MVPKYKVGDKVYYIARKGMGMTSEEARRKVVHEGFIKRVYVGKTLISYYIRHRRASIHEERLFATREEAETKLKGV